MATRMAMKMADYVVTEAGFGADLGAEKFLDIKCRMAGYQTVCSRCRCNGKSIETSRRRIQGGSGNRKTWQHWKKACLIFCSMWKTSRRAIGLPAVVAINRFPTDTEAELKLVEDKCRQLGVNVALSEVWGKGGEGGIALAEEVVRLCEEPNDFHFTYELDCSIRRKDCRAIAQKIYHADDVKFLPAAEKADEAAGRPGIWKSADMRGEDPVQLF